jgi:hypothetical protein
MLSTQNSVVNSLQLKGCPGVVFLLIEFPLRQ